MMDERIGFHFAEIIDDGLAPLGAVTAVADAAFAELVGDFDFEPEGIFGIAGIGGIEEHGGCDVQF